MVNKYIPKQGDIIYLDFNPTKGHEQKGKRPAVVVSIDDFNRNAHMIMVCPITSNTKEFPTHYVLEDSKKVTGSVLCEHLRSIDHNARKIVFVEKTSENDLLSILMLLNSCLEQ